MPNHFDRRLKDYRKLLHDRDETERQFRAESQRAERLEAELAGSHERLELLATLLTAQEQMRAPESEPDGTRRRRTQGRQSGIRGELRSIMRARPAGPWTPAELEDAFTERGREVSRSNIQTTLARMDKAGEVVKIRRGAYRLARDERR